MSSLTSYGLLVVQETPLSKPDSPPGDPGVLQALIKYLKSQLDPLYDARVCHQKNPSPTALKRSTIAVLIG